jgi:hypothetical protein
MRRYEKIGSGITVEQAPLRQQRPRDHTHMGNQELEQRLPKILRAMKVLTRAVKVASEQYRLDTDLQTLVALSEFLGKFNESVVMN